MLSQKFALFTLLLSACLPGWHLIDTRDAYWIETQRCEVHANGDAEDLRKCQAMVDRKYGAYWAEGKRYPETAGHTITGCAAPMDCRGR